MTVNKEFVYVGLLKYFFLNVNWSLIALVIALVGYVTVFARKCYQRNTYIRTRNLENKDRYTMLRRTCQWVHDHFTFPYVMLFNFIVFFCTILYLKSIDKPTSSPLNDSAETLMYEETSFPFHVGVIFLTFAMYCFEIFLSLSEYAHSKLTDR